jgi:hypothetical protein
MGADVSDRLNPPRRNTDHDHEVDLTDPPFDWSADPELAELLLDSHKAALGALVDAARWVVRTLGPTEGGPPEDECATCQSVARLRDALAGVELTLGSER